MDATHHTSAFNNSSPDGSEIDLLFSLGSENHWPGNKDANKFEDVIDMLASVSSKDRIVSLRPATSSGAKKLFLSLFHLICKRGIGHQTGGETRRRLNETPPWGRFPTFWKPWKLMNVRGCLDTELTNRIPRRPCRANDGWQGNSETRHDDGGGWDGWGTIFGWSWVR